MHRTAGRSYLRVLTDTGFINAQDEVLVSWEGGSPQGKLLHLAPTVSCCLAATRRQAWGQVLSVAEREAWKVCVCTTSSNASLPWTARLERAGHTQAWWVAEALTLMRRWERRDVRAGPHESPGKLRLLMARRPPASGHHRLDDMADITAEQLVALAAVSQGEPWWHHHRTAIVERGVKTLRHVLAEPSAVDSWTASRLRELCEGAGVEFPRTERALGEVASRELWVWASDVDHLLSDVFAACDPVLAVNPEPGSPLIGRLSVAAAVACNLGADDVIGPACPGVGGEEVRAALPLVSAGVALAAAAAAMAATVSV